MYKIIDFHSHIYPDKIAKKATQSISDFYSIDMVNKEGRSSVLLQSGEKAGINKFLVHSVAVTPKQVTSINDFIANECNTHPENFIGFMTIHPDTQFPIEEIERAKKLGLKGLKIHPDVQRFNVDDKKMLPIYDYFQDKAPILIHCGDYRYEYSHPKKIKNILKMFPHLKIIAAHFGGWSIFDLALEYLSDENCFVDTSSSFAFLGKKRSGELIRQYGFDRVIFGVDFPMWSHKTELDFFYSLGFSDLENKKILHDNAANLIDSSTF